MSRLLLSLVLLAACTANAAAKRPAKPASKRSFHWKGFTGPKTKTALEGPKAWAVVPVGLDGDFRIVKIARLDLLRTAAAEHVFKQGSSDDEIFVPAGLTLQAAPAATLRPGTAVMADVAAASGFGRVAAVEGEGEERRIKVNYMWGGSMSDSELAADEVVVLTDALAFGHPVAYQEGGAWNVGQLAYIDKDVCWLITCTGSPQRVPTATVKPLRLQQVFRKGAKVWAAQIGRLAPAKVLAVQHGGLAYKVRFADGKSAVVDLANVTAPLE